MRGGWSWKALNFIERILLNNNIFQSIAPATVHLHGSIAMSSDRAGLWIESKGMWTFIIQFWSPSIHSIHRTRNPARRNPSQSSSLQGRRIIIAELSWVGMCCAVLEWHGMLRWALARPLPQYNDYNRVVFTNVFICYGAYLSNNVAASAPAQDQQWHQPLDRRRSIPSPLLFGPVEVRVL